MTDKKEFDGELYHAQCADCGCESFSLMMTEDKEIFGTECTKCFLRTTFENAVFYSGTPNPIPTIN